MVISVVAVGVAAAAGLLLGIGLVGILSAGKVADAWADGYVAGLRKGQELADEE